MDAHLSQFHGTNHVPSDAELLKIEKLLAPYSARLLQLREELDEAESKIAGLKKEREDILQVIEPLKSLSSLIRRFPREIMELIFMRSIPDAAYGRSTLSIYRAPLVLLRVCKTWREIALTTPQLWTSVELEPPLHLFHSPENGPDVEKQQRAASFLEQFDQWLGRSETRPLSITVRGLLPLMGQLGTIPQGLASKLASHSHRWESVDFDAQWLIGHFNNLPPESLSALKHLRFCSNGFLSHLHDRPYFHGFLAAPNLKGLQLQVTFSSREYSKLPVNWANLTYLSLDFSRTHRLNFSQDEWLQAPGVLPIMKQCQKLRILSLLLLAPAHQTLPELETQITLSNLEALNVSGCKLQIHYLLQSINTPRIREVHYQPLLKPSRPDEAPPFNVALPLTSFLQRYGNQTEILSVNMLSISRDDLQSWLECTPALKQLTLGPEFQFAPPPPMISAVPTGLKTPFDDSWIGLLTPKRDQPYFCPNLKIFRSSIRARISGDTVLTFLKARTDPSLVLEGGGIIEEVSIHKLPYNYPLGESTDAEDERLKSIREAGVRLSFRKSTYYDQFNLGPGIATINGTPSGTCVTGFGPEYGVDFKLF